MKAQLDYYKEENTKAKKNIRDKDLEVISFITELKELRDVFVKM